MAQRSKSKKPEQNPIEARDWHQQSNEPVKAYEAFKIYCEIGPNRTHKEVVKRTGISLPTIDSYSTKYKWQSRIRAFLAHNDQRTEEIFEALIRENAASEAAKWAKRRQEFREEVFDYGRQLMKRGKEMLAYPIEKEERKGENGETIIIKPARWNANSIVNTIRLALEMGMLATGLAPGTHPLDEIDWENISSEDLDKILKDSPITISRERN